MCSEVEAQFLVHDFLKDTRDSLRDFRGIWAVVSIESFHLTDRQLQVHRIDTRGPAIEAHATADVRVRLVDKVDAGHLRVVVLSDALRLGNEDFTPLPLPKLAVDFEGTKYT